MQKLIQVLTVLFCALAGACSANVESAEPEPCPEAPAPVCAPVQKCMAREAGYVWAGLQTAKVGECTLYRYNCMPEGEPADESCEQRWETVCAPGDLDYDPNYGERGE
jgi:hypothetical protein